MPVTRSTRIRTRYGVAFAIFLIAIATADLWSPLDVPLTTIGLPIVMVLYLLAASDRRRALPISAAVVVFWIWIVAFGLTTDALEGTRFDVIAMVSRLDGPFGILTLIAAGYAVALTAAAITWRTLARRLRPPPPCCPSCHYDRTGLPNNTPCPECGTSQA